MPNTAPVPRTPKRIVICLDGTGNRIRATRNTNVIRLLRALENTTGEQLLYYDPGVGTFSSAGARTRIGRWFSRLLGLAFGLGLKTNLAEAYTFLMNHWEPGDRIFIFGFSRGAYTARALAGLLHKVGIPRQSSENLVQYAISTYARRHKWTDQDRAEAAEFSSTVCRAVDGGRFSVPVHYLGIWDTVSAPGIFRRDLHFENTRRLTNVRAGRHAISIDEKRRPYRECTVRNPRIEEAWFAGVHCDVGGGFDDHRLSDISLMWVLEGAREHGVLLRRTEELRELPNLCDGDALAPVHRMSRTWALLVYRHRQPAPGVGVHASVRVRCEREPTYGRRLHDPYWVDRTWDEPTHHRLGRAA
ncbi:DUF2235 domain-containing protein [Rhodococcus sp. NPDC059234]|uniref:DUF2235 domain-containing protein n=1 Tax=Rhodococcus sp. NPDC059234 TaxID=3346781 RepID=UPI00366D52CF